MKKIKTIETVEDIVAEMRERAWNYTEGPVAAKVLEDYANRIEDASERK